MLSVTRISKHGCVPNDIRAAPEGCNGRGFLAKIVLWQKVVLYYNTLLAVHGIVRGSKMHMHRVDLTHDPWMTLRFLLELMPLRNFCHGGCTYILLQLLPLLIAFWGLVSASGFFLMDAVKKWMLLRQIFERFN